LLIIIKGENMPVNKMRPIHPGEILLEEFLKPLKMSANALSIALRIPAPRINDIVRQKRGLSADTALRLARYFGSTAQFWLNLQTAYELKIVEQQMGTSIQKEILPRQVA
jgi:addiction module HigA family antidote